MAQYWLAYCSDSCLSGSSLCSTTQNHRDHQPSRRTLRTFRFFFCSFHPRMLTTEPISDSYLLKRKLNFSFVWIHFFQLPSPNLPSFPGWVPICLRGQFRRTLGRCFPCSGQRRRHGVPNKRTRRRQWCGTSRRQKDFCDCWVQCLPLKIRQIILLGVK